MSHSGKGGVATDATGPISHQGSGSSAFPEGSSATLRPLVPSSRTLGSTSRPRRGSSIRFRMTVPVTPENERHLSSPEGASTRF